MSTRSRQKEAFTSIENRKRIFRKIAFVLCPILLLVFGGALGYGLHDQFSTPKLTVKRANDVIFILQTRFSVAVYRKTRNSANINHWKT